MDKFLRKATRLLLIGSAILFLYLVYSILHPIGINLMSQVDFENDLEESLILYGDWFVKNQTEAGDFNYELDVRTGEVVDGYNVVRQAGSLYSLCHAYKYTQNPEYKESIEKGIAFFSNLFEDVENNVPTVRINHQGSSKSNTVALFLLALIEYVEADPNLEEQYLNTAESLANYLLLTQREDGGFWVILDPDSQRESDYNNGESFYTLIRMYKLTGDEKYLDGAKNAADYIILKYTEEEFNHSLYAWAMEGFAHLYDVNKNKEYWDFMKFYTDRYFNTNGQNIIRYLEGNNIYPPKANLGVYLEGLAHVAWIAKDVDSEYYPEVIDFIEKSLEYLMTLQINGPRSARKSDFELISGGICYDNLCATERVDIIHHNLSAIYLYLIYAK